MAVRAIDLLCEASLDITAIEKAGESVGHGQLLEFPSFIFQECTVDGDRKLRGDRKEEVERIFIKNSPVHAVREIHHAYGPSRERYRATEERRGLVAAIRNSIETGLRDVGDHRRLVAIKNYLRNAPSDLFICRRFSSRTDQRLDLE